LDAHVNDEDVVDYALEGLPDTYNKVCGYMHWKDTFPDLKIERSLLITKEMRLKSRALALPVDFSSLMVLVAKSSNTQRSPSTPQGKSWKPCFNFAKGTFCFGDSCRYVHDTNVRVGSNNNGLNKGRETSENSTNALLTKLLAQLGNLGLHATVPNSTTSNNAPVAFHASPTTPFSPSGFTVTCSSPSAGPTPSPPLGFTIPTQHVPYYYPTGPTTHYYPIAPNTNVAAQNVSNAPNNQDAVVGQAQPAQSSSTGSVATSRQATLLPQAFTTGTLHDPTISA
ncbi:ribonuclease H-like domain-containing protein, partial [Tanacetum coccineum]